MKKKLSYVMFFVIIPLFIYLTARFVFSEKQYLWVSVCVAVLACFPFFLHFEKTANDTKKSVLISVLIAISVSGRILFAAIPGFKPVTAVTVIAAMYFGADVGFMTGALSAIISNIYFGQGPFTPFQMFAWGVIGLIAGVFGKTLRKSKALLYIYGALSGVMFSLFMDTFTVLWADGYFNVSRYFGAVIAALPMTTEYSVSNVLFLFILGKPLGKTLKRIKVKYGL